MISASVLFSAAATILTKVASFWLTRRTGRVRGFAEVRTALLLADWRIENSRKSIMVTKAPSSCVEMLLGRGQLRMSFIMHALRDCCNNSKVTMAHWPQCSPSMLM